MKVYENEFIKILFHAQERIIEVLWKKESIYMRDSDYQEFMLRYRDFCLELQPQKSLQLPEDSQKGFTIAPELQEWTFAEVAVPLAMRGICEYVGLVVTDDIFSQLSAEQTMEEVMKVGNMTHKFFNSRETAWEWLVSIGSPKKL